MRKCKANIFCDKHRLLDYYADMHNTNTNTAKIEVSLLLIRGSLEASECHSYPKGS